jgi:GMP synthase (glutamine-hydrolysing)
VSTPREAATAGREVLVLEHTPAAGASAFTSVLDGRAGSLPWRRVDVPTGDPLPDHLDAVAGLVVMGGTMSAVDPSAHDWMGPELDLLRRAVDAEVPVLGVCLGAQLLGAALGGTVEQRDVPRVAALPLHRTPEGRSHPVTAGWPDGGEGTFVHEDHVAVPPPGATALLEVDEPQDVRADGDGAASTDAWSLGSAVAVQFHPEVTAEQLLRWLDGGYLDDMVARAGTDVEAFRARVQRRDRVAVALGRALLGRFLDGPVRGRAEAS